MVCINKKIKLLQIISVDLHSICGGIFINAQTYMTTFFYSSYDLYNNVILI